MQVITDQHIVSQVATILEEKNNKKLEHFSLNPNDQYKSEEG